MIAGRGREREVPAVQCVELTDVRIKTFSQPDKIKTVHVLNPQRRD